MRTLCIAVVCSLLVACKSSNDAQVSPTSTAAKGGDEHGHEGAKPGSYEDWCGEHAVPESKCTKCNPKLVPAFKASNDWCEEHSLPESQCTKCNPDLKIVRPPKGS